MEAFLNETTAVDVSHRLLCFLGFCYTLVWISVAVKLLPVREPHVPTASHISHLAIRGNDTGGEAKLNE